MSKLSEIYEGWINLIYPNPRIKQIAEERFDICSNCDYLQKNKVCKLCGCYMPAKVRSMKSSCDDNNW